MTYLAVEEAAALGSSGWEWKPWRRVAQIRREPNRRSDQRLLALSADRGVVPRPDDGGRQLPTDETISNYWIVRRHDVVFNPMWAFQGGVAVSELNGAVSTAYRIYTPSKDLHPRFVHYFLRSRPAIEQFGLLIRGVTTFDRSVTREDFEGMPVPVPPMREQRAVADFLDRETARIDILITKKQRLSDRLQQRFWAKFSSRVSSEAFPSVQLRRAVYRITDGPFGSAFSSSDYVDEGVFVVRLGNIGFAEFRRDPAAFIPTDMYASFFQYRVSKGDLLIAALGDDKNHAGRACVAPDLGQAIVKGKCVCVQVDTTRADGVFLALLLSSPFGAEVIAAEARGSTRSMINLDLVKHLRIPLPSLSEQRAIAQECLELRAKTEDTTNVVQRQISLLQERRQAFITAAVTGQMKVSSAA